NVGQKLKFLSESDPLPLAYRAGAAYRLTEDLKVAIEGAYPKNGPTSFHVGVEWPSEDQRGFCVRTGFSSDRTRELNALAGFAAGVAVPIWNQEISYAWMPLGDFGHAHYFSLIMKFGAPKQKEILAPGKG